MGRGRLGREVGACPGLPGILSHPQTKDFPETLKISPSKVRGEDAAGYSSQDTSLAGAFHLPSFRTLQPRAGWGERFSRWDCPLLMEKVGLPGKAQESAWSMLTL